jgi:hypothetical protein
MFQVGVEEVVKGKWPEKKVPCKVVGVCRLVSPLESCFGPNSSWMPRMGLRRKENQSREIEILRL